MDWIKFHAIIGISVEVFAGFITALAIFETAMKLDEDPSYRAQVKRKILRFIRKILRKIIKVES